jgi:hypothetical protein
VGGAGDMAVALVARGPDPASPRCFGGLLVVRRQGRPLGGCGRSRVADLPRRTVAAGAPCSERKRSPDSSDGMAAVPSGVALPTEGAILEWQPRCTLGVKTRSRFWTSDGGAYGCRNLHEGVVSRDTVRLLAWSAFCLRLLRRWQQICRWACVMGGCLPHAAAPALLSWWLEVSTQLRFRLLTASHSAWGCFAIPGAVRDNVEEQRLQLRRLVRTWPAADRDGVFNMAETSRCGSSSKDGVGDIFGLLLRWRRLACGEATS